MITTQAELDLRRLQNLYGYDYEIGTRGEFFEAHHRRSGEVIRAETPEILRQQIIEHQKGFRAGLITRRQALGAGAAALVIRGGHKPRPAGIRIAPKLTLGSNEQVAREFRRGIPQAIPVGERIYSVTGDTWPTRNPYSLVSIRPDPSQLFEGKLTSQIRHLCHSAPPGARLTAYDENIPGNCRHYPADVNNATASRRIHETMHEICEGTPVGYGPLTGGPTENILPWLPRHADWWGTDIYFNEQHFATPAGLLSEAELRRRMNHNLEAWQDVSGQEHPAICIGETAAPLGKQVNWFTWLFDWLYDHDGKLMLTFWQVPGRPRQGTLSTPWHAGSPVAARLAFLAAQGAGLISW